jgi:hypothetical protein
MTNELPEYIVDEMIAYLYTNGAKIKKSDFKSVVHSPISIFPVEVGCYLI